MPPCMSTLSLSRFRSLTCTGETFALMDGPSCRGPEGVELERVFPHPRADSKLISRTGSISADCDSSVGAAGGSMEAHALRSRRTAEASESSHFRHWAEESGGRAADQECERVEGPSPSSSSLAEVVAAAGSQQQQQQQSATCQSLGWKPETVGERAAAPAGFLSWTVVLFVGLGTGLTAFGMSFVADTWPLPPGFQFISMGGFAPDSQFIGGCFTYERMNVALACLAASICAIVAVATGGLDTKSYYLGGGASSWGSPAASARAILANAAWRACQLLVVRQMAANAVAHIAHREKKLQTSEPASSVPSGVDTCPTETPALARPLPGSGILSERNHSASALPPGQAVMAAASGQSEGGIVSEDDLAKLLWRLECPEEDEAEGGAWECIVEKSAPSVSYTAWRRDLKDGGPTEYRSITVHEAHEGGGGCTPELVRDFIMDSRFLLEWDSIVRSAEQLGVCCRTRCEVGRFTKKYPLCALKEYVLAWRLWHDAPQGAFFCVTKAANHPGVPRQAKPARVEQYLSSWRVRPAPGRSGAVEITMMVSEDAGMGRSMAKMAFRSAIWPYIRKSDAQLRVYQRRQLAQQQQAAGGSGTCDVPPNAVLLAAQVPARLLAPGGPARHLSAIRGGSHELSAPACDYTSPLALSRSMSSPLSGTEAASAHSAELYAGPDGHRAGSSGGSSTHSWSSSSSSSPSPSYSGGRCSASGRRERGSDGGCGGGALASLGALRARVNAAAAAAVGASPLGRMLSLPSPSWRRRLALPPSPHHHYSRSLSLSLSQSHAHAYSHAHGQEQSSRVQQQQVVRAWKTSPHFARSLSSPISRRSGVRLSPRQSLDDGHGQGSVDRAGGDRGVVRSVLVAGWAVALTHGGPLSATLAVALMLKRMASAAQAQRRGKEQRVDPLLLQAAAASMPEEQEQQLQEEEVEEEVLSRAWEQHDVTCPAQQ